ncbi:MAG TPA: PhzF family phenazine biosynthesis protein [Gemmatimonadales bacterium]|nr:PhzF family phenazine biosynthesis protein [Gemmatimonadales bacterium]
MPLGITQIDAFTATPFAGNSAAVCLLPAPREDAWMQAVAREMNLAETAFLLRADGQLAPGRPGNGSYQLRWFTPAVEVDLCGHATLASAHFLWEAGHLPPDATARFETRSGLLTASRAGEWISLDFPVTPAVPCPVPPALERALGARLCQVAQSRFDYLVELESAAAVRAIAPDFTLLERIGGRGVIVTAASDDPKFDFVSRFFAPASGIPEDPVTGSAHCVLGPFWGPRLSKSDMVGYQASARGGVVRVGLRGDRVLLGGQAVTVLHGQLLY